MRSHLSNAAYGVLDYAAYPLAMLAATPSILHSLGVAQYGVWVVCTAAVSTGGIIASGFGDANIHLVAAMRSRGDHAALQAAVRNMVGINLMLGSILALISLMFSPLLARHVTLDSSLYAACVESLRLASVLMLVRALESVCISTQRAFDRYGDAVQVSIAMRITSIAAAAILVRFGFGVAAIMVETFAFITLGTGIQLYHLKRAVALPSLRPTFDRRTASSLFSFGIFSWLLAVSGVLFTQVDRLVLGASLGASAVTAYALCVQISQPIYGVAAAGLHFLFPYLSGRGAVAEPSSLRRPLLLAFLANLAFVSISTVAILWLGQRLLSAWVGSAIARASTDVLSPIVWSFATLGLSVTAYYALMALRRIRIVMLFGMLGGGVMLLLIVWLLPREGVHGVAMARLAYGAISLTLYLPLLRALRSTHSIPLSAPLAQAVCEEA